MNGSDNTPHRWLPRTRHCFVCGVENSDGFRLRLCVEDNIVAADYDAAAADNGYRGIVHGGIAMTLMDEAMTWAAILATGSICVAAEMLTRFRRPMPVGMRYRVEGRVVRADRRLVLTEGRILDAEGREYSTATGKYVPRAGARAALSEIDFAEPVPFELQPLTGDGQPGGQGPLQKGNARDGVA